ncbi:3',5'-cyclic-nucleotide phosphodiesterase (EC 3.1.4.17) [Azospirillum doebereinerae]
MEPPGHQIHAWRADTGVVDHTAAIGAFDGPHPLFRDGRLIDCADRSSRAFAPTVMRLSSIRRRQERA